MYVDAFTITMSSTCFTQILFVWFQRTAEIEAIQTELDEMRTEIAALRNGDDDEEGDGDGQGDDPEKGDKV
jgi:hypothetical protein